MPPRSSPGDFRYDIGGPGDLPAVGDWLAVDPGRGGPALVQAVLDRRSAFRRYGGDPGACGRARLVDEQVLAANVDVALIVAGLDGDFAGIRALPRRRLLRRLDAGAHPQQGRRSPRGRCLSRRRGGRRAGRPLIHDHGAATHRRGGARGGDPATGDGQPSETGLVGVGKLTLAEPACPPGTARQRVKDVREDDSRGRHTTTGSCSACRAAPWTLIDTPIRALEVTGAGDGLDDTFAEIADTTLPVGTCRHDGEPGRAVTAAVAGG